MEENEAGEKGNTVVTHTCEQTKHHSTIETAFKEDEETAEEDPAS